jgi:hypothetical protein
MTQLMSDLGFQDSNSSKRCQPKAKGQKLPRSSLVAVKKVQYNSILPLRSNPTLAVKGKKNSSEKEGIVYTFVHGEKDR